jgi:hypothetical protein
MFVCPDGVELGPGRAGGLVCLPGGVLGLVHTLLKAARSQVKGLDGYRGVNSLLKFSTKTS